MQPGEGQRALRLQALRTQDAHVPSAFAQVLQQAGLPDPGFTAHDKGSRPTACNCVSSAAIRACSGFPTVEHVGRIRRTRRRRVRGRSRTAIPAN